MAKAEPKETQTDAMWVFASQGTFSIEFCFIPEEQPHLATV